MDHYHLRDPEKALSQQEQLEVIRSQRFLSIAMCRDNRPYLVTMNYGYDQKANCFYVHASPAGKKIDYLQTNPQVWGQIVHDLGYCQGQCTHAYHSVMFQAVAEFVTDPAEKLKSFEIMIDMLESDPAPMKQRLTPDLMQIAAVIRLRVLSMEGKAKKPK